MTTKDTNGYRRFFWLWLGTTMVFGGSAAAFVVGLAIQVAIMQERITAQTVRMDHLSAEHLNTRGDVDELRKRIDKREGR